MAEFRPRSAPDPRSKEVVRAYWMPKAIAVLREGKRTATGKEPPSFRRIAGSDFAKQLDLLQRLGARTGAFLKGV